MIHQSMRHDQFSNYSYYYKLRSQPLFRELKIILDIFSRGQRGRTAEGVICHVASMVA